MCTQSSRLEMIDTLFTPVGDDDHVLIKDSVVDFLKNNNGQKPEQIIIFRDGVSESQFNQVLNDELAQIMEVNISDIQFLMSQSWIVMPT